jgi:integrase
MARQEARRQLGIVAAGGDPAAEKAAKREAKRGGRAVEGSVAAVAEEWLARDQAGNRSVDEVRRVMFKDVLPAWGDRQLSAIRKRDVISLLDSIVDRGAGGQANRTLSYVRRFLNWAAARDLIETNVAQHIEKVVPENRRDRVLNDEELANVWRAAVAMGSPVGDGLRLLILTGARLSEVFEARWSELDLKHRCIRLPASRAKAKEGREIYLSDLALDTVKAIPRYAGSDWLLTVSGQKPFSNFGHAKAKLDRLIMEAKVNVATSDGGDPNQVESMTPWVVHDLRRTVATGLQRQGIRLEVIETVLGHVSGSRAGVIGTYQRHRFQDEAQAALEAWAKHVEKLCGARTWQWETAMASGTAESRRRYLANDDATKASHAPQEVAR